MNKTITFLFMGMAMNSVFAENNYGFLYKNEAINPACVALFNSSEADLPYIRSINLNVCQHSNAAFQQTRFEEGWHYFYLNDKNENEGSYRYKVIGKASNGIYAIRTLSSGGGTGIYGDLLLIKLVKRNQYNYKAAQLTINEITEMKMLGSIQGGDRCVGDFSDIRIENNTLFIKQHNGETPVGDCSNAKINEFTVDLSHLSSS